MRRPEGGTFGDPGLAGGGRADGKATFRGAQAGTRLGIPSTTAGLGGGNPGNREKTEMEGHSARGDASGPRPQSPFPTGSADPWPPAPNPEYLRRIRRSRRWRRGGAHDRPLGALPDFRACAHLPAIGARPSCLRLRAEDSANPAQPGPAHSPSGRFPTAKPTPSPARLSGRSWGEAAAAVVY